MSALVKSILLLLLASSLAACGFHLRGQGGSVAILPFSEVQISGDTETANALRDYLKRQPGYKLVQSTPASGVQIALKPEVRDRQISSINTNGQVTEYRLTLRVPFSAQTRGETFLDNGVVTLYRDLSWNDNSVLSKDLEEQALWQSMARDAVPLILYRVGATARQQQKTDASSAQ